MEAIHKGLDRFTCLNQAMCASTLLMWTHWRVTLSPGRATIEGTIVEPNSTVVQPTEGEKQL